MIAIDIWLKTDTKRNTQCISLHRITAKFGNNLCSLLLPCHTLLGCVITSASMGRGRQKGFQLLSSSTDKYMEIGLLGDCLQLDDKETDCCEEFVRRLYRPNSDISDLTNCAVRFSVKQLLKYKLAFIL